MLDKNPIVKKTTVPFKELKSLAAPYAGNCAHDYEKLEEEGNCNCACACNCNCDCYEAEDCACDCLQSFCDCNCVCDCGALGKDGVLFIQEGAKEIFANTYRERKEIQEVIFPKSLKSIGCSAFSECESLSVLHLPEGLLKIDAWAFLHCAMRELVLPDSVEELVGKAFQRCRWLKHVHIGKGLKAWDGYPLFQCSRLEEITVDEDNPYFKSVDGVLFSKDGKTLLCYPANKAGVEYRIPDGVETIGCAAFYENHTLKKVYFPDGLHTIEESAFHFALVAELSFPKSLVNVRDRAFGGCKCLTRINFRGKMSDFKIKVPNSFTFPVNHRGDRATLYTEDGKAFGI